MAYVPTTWVDKVTKLGPTNLNHLETGLQAAAAVADLALPTPAGVNGQFLKRVGGVWVPTTFALADLPANIPASGIAAYPADASKVLAGDGTWPGGMVKISDTILGAPAASIDITGIPATFRHLKILMSLRCDQAVTSQAASIRLTNDSGANYSDVMEQGGTALTTGEVNSGTAWGEFGSTGTSAGASMFWETEVLIQNYARTDRVKSYTAVHAIAFALTTTLHLQRVATGVWNSTAAINRITLLASAGNFVAGSVLTIYGLG